MQKTTSLQRQEVEQEVCRFTDLTFIPEAESNHPPTWFAPASKWLPVPNRVRAQQVQSEMEAADPQRFSFPLARIFSSLPLQQC